MTSCHSILQIGQTHKRLCAAECHISSLSSYGEAWARSFHDITLQLSQKQRYCTNIEKAQKGTAAQTVAFHTIDKLHFLRATDIVPYYATQRGQANITQATKLRLRQRELTATLNQTHILKIFAPGVRITPQVGFQRQHLNTVHAVGQMF